MNVHVPTDIDECLSSKGGCAQLCVNNQGSHECDCLLGFALDQDSVNCNGEYFYVIENVRLL